MGAHWRKHCQWFNLNAARTPNITVALYRIYNMSSKALVRKYSMTL